MDIKMDIKNEIINEYTYIVNEYRDILMSDYSCNEHDDEMYIRDAQESIEYFKFLIDKL